jgi:hypothetical protein
LHGTHRRPAVHVLDEEIRAVVRRIGRVFDAEK